MSTRVKIALVISILLSFFLGFIDEGYYNFNWMSDPGSWVAICIYTSIFFLLQMGFISSLAFLQKHVKKLSSKA